LPTLTYKVIQIDALIGLVPCKLGHVLELYGNRVGAEPLRLQHVDAIRENQAIVLVLVLVAFGGQRAG
jgi:hypothetical protein